MIIRSLNRTAIIVKPKQPYIDWVNSVGGYAPPLDYDDLCAEYTIYLIEDVDSISDKIAILKPHFKTIFEEELKGWHRFEDDWPTDRDIATFFDWFDVDVHSMVLDLCHRRIRTERFDL